MGGCLGGGERAAHAALPAALLYLLVAHAVHVPPLGPVYPRLQRQAVAALFAVADVTEFTGQSAHAALPASLLYLLVSHTVHVPPLGRVPKVTNRLPCIVSGLGNHPKVETT
jgi:MoxR-like ATPase